MNPTIAEIRLFAGNFEPKGWAFCHGQLLAISQNTALFSLLGTTYGGNGQTTFALPDLRSRVPIQQGQGSGLSFYDLGEVGGIDNVTLLTSNLPSHNHGVIANSLPAAGTLNNPANAYFSAGPVDSTSGQPINTRYATSPTGPMAVAMVGISGGSQPVPVTQPSLALHYIISLYGIYPSRN